MDDNNFQNYNENRNSVDRSRPMGLLLFKFLTKWPPPAILDVRNSLSIAFLAILDQYGIFIFLQNGCRWPFWMSEIHFRLNIILAI